MKKILLVIAILFTFLLQSCENKVIYKTDGEYNVIEIDSCQYIKGRNQLAHKGNCKYCKQRNK